MLVTWEETAVLNSKKKKKNVVPTYTVTDILEKSFSIIFYSINAYFNFCTFYTFGGKLR